MVFLFVACLASVPSAPGHSLPADHALTPPVGVLLPRDGVAGSLRPVPSPVPNPLTSAAHDAASAGARLAGPLPRPHSPEQGSASGTTSVNPAWGYTSEPAPMGIADFGVTGSLVPYSYSTTEFVATANITSLEGDSSQSGKVDGFQLNDVVIFQDGPTNFTYWIQNAPNIDTATDTLVLDDEVWNMTTPSAYLSHGAVVGLGETSDGLYDYSPPGPSSSYPGNFEPLSLPLTLQLRTTSYLVDGVPSVGVGYDLGSGWVDQDNLSFPFARNMTDDNFVVDGYSLNGGHLFTDSEFDLVSAGDGYSQIDTGSVLQMTLEYSNGHNLESIPNAWNFGSDTAETISNVLDTPLASPPDGIPGAAWAKGSGTLGPLYNLTQEAQLTIIGPANQTVDVNGVPTPYLGGEALLTLAPGTYEIALIEQRAQVEERNVTLVAGESNTLDFTYQNVTLEESGLPPGTSWSVRWNGTTFSSLGTSIEIQSLDGTFDLSISPVPGYATSQYNRTLLVDGGITINVTWVPFLWGVTFSEAGLPPGTEWWVMLGTGTVQSTQTALSFRAVNGTLPFMVGAPYAYEPSESTGGITILGYPQDLAISFSLRPSYIAGTVAPGNATVTVDGVAATLIDGAFNVSVSAGSYVVMATLSGYSTYGGNVTTTAGNVTPVIITLQPASTRQAEPSTSVVSSPWTTFAPFILFGIAIIAVVALALILRRGGRRTLLPPPRLAHGVAPAGRADGKTGSPEASESTLGSSK
jgi:hypothetical protein